jgi:hypothetical protein
VRGKELTKEGDAVDFDVVQNKDFPTWPRSSLGWPRFSGLGVGEQVAADEAKFLDRSRTRAYVVEEHVTSGWVMR